MSYSKYGGCVQIGVVYQRVPMMAAASAVASDPGSRVCVCACVCVCVCVLCVLCSCVLRIRVCVFVWLPECIHRRLRLWQTVIMRPAQTHLVRR